MSHWNNNSIAHRLTFQVILFSTMVTLLLTALQLYLDYRQDIRNIQDFFSSIEMTSIRPLEESVWMLDELQVNLQLEGLIKHQDIVFAAVEMNGQMTWTKGVPAANKSIMHIYPLFHHVRGGIERIGGLHVVASLESVYQRLLRRIVILLAGNAVKTFLVAGFILLLFQRNITQHLTRLAQYVQDINLRQRVPEPLVLARSAPLRFDELDQVTAALNFLCESGHRAFNELQAQEQRLRLFFDATEEVVLGVDTQGRCTFINRAGLEHFSVSDKEDLIGQYILENLFRDMTNGPQPCAFIEQVRATISEGKVLLTDEMPLYLPHSAARLTISLRSYPVMENGQCRGAIVFFADISRQQKLEQEKQLFTKVIRQAPALILIVDANRIVEYVNARFEQLIGYSATELVGRKMFNCFQEDAEIDEQLAEVSESIRRGQTWSGLFTGTNVQGRRLTLETIIFPIFNQSAQLTNVVTMGRDVTQEKQLVAQLHHAHKMEAVGKLAASIAHEFGNPLLGIRFALRNVQQRPGIEPEDRNLLHLAESECDRMRKLIRDLQQFNRPSTGRKRACELHRILDEILALHQTLLIKKRIALVREYADCSIRLSAVEDQIRQVFINLIINAIDAMAVQGGTLTIRTTPGMEKAMIAVGDSGSGIAPENIDRIFEPFFTTKPAVEGTGLGLPVSYGIVQAHGGTIEVQSVPGETIFTVALPLAPPEAALAGKEAGSVQPRG